jgi:hypothetical protein
MTYEELVRSVEPRCRMMGLPHDALHLLSLSYQILQEMADRFDYDAFTVHSSAICITTAGVEHYPLPDTFGRPLHPTNDTKRQSPIFLWNGTAKLSLTYVAPVDFPHDLTTTQGTPAKYTIEGRELWLNPPPDDNSDDDYIVRGTFIKAIAYPEMDEVIPLDQPTALIDAVLAEAALDAGVAQAAVFMQKKIMSMQVLAGSQAKYRTGFSQARGERSWRR